MELHNGDSLVWWGPAGMQWGHLLLVPIGFTCIRFRSQWRPAGPALHSHTPGNTLAGMTRRHEDEDGQGGGGGGLTGALLVGV
jgi:hypothetical protein